MDLIQRESRQPVDFIRNSDLLRNTAHPSATPHPPLGTLYFLLHHGCLIEPLLHPLAERLEYIVKNKPATERVTRLRWLQPVRQVHRLPQDVLVAADLLTQVAVAGRNATGMPSFLGMAKLECAAWESFDQAVNTHWEEIAGLHKEEQPGCPFDYAGNRQLQFDPPPALKPFDDTATTFKSLSKSVMIDFSSTEGQGPSPLVGLFKFK